jgi:hypothetical protein
VEGENLVVLRFSSEGNARRSSEVVASAIRSGPDVIFASSSRLVKLLQEATTAIQLSGGVPRLSPYVDRLLGGQIQVTFADMPPSVEHIRTGTLRALAVTTTERSSSLPGIPTIGDFLPGFEASAWQGISAPKDTPAVKLNCSTRRSMPATNPVIKARLGDLGLSVLSGSPVEFGKLIASPPRLAVPCSTKVFASFSRPPIFSMSLVLC